MRTWPNRSGLRRPLRRLLKKKFKTNKVRPLRSDSSQ